MSCKPCNRYFRPNKEATRKDGAVVSRKQGEDVADGVTAETFVGACKWDDCLPRARPCARSVMMRTSAAQNKNPAVVEDLKNAPRGWVEEQRVIKCRREKHKD